LLRLLLPVASTYASRFPDTVYAGDTVAWEETYSDYPASGGWSATCEIVGSSADLGQYTATANGDAFRFEISASTTAGWSAGRYWWQIYVTKGTERYTVLRGEFEVKADLATATTYDGRSHARTALDAIEAVLENRATQDQMAYQVAGRRLDRTPLEDLLKLRDYYRREVAREEAADRIAKGLGRPGRIVTRFI